MNNKELRIGVVGVGAIGRTHIERINDQLQGGKVVACSDINTEFGKKVAEKYGCEFYENGEEMIASGKIDAVIVTTIDHTMSSMLWRQSRQVSMYSVKNRWHLKPKRAKGLWRQRSREANNWFR